MRKGMEIEIKVGTFVAVGLGLIMFAILMLGGAESFFVRKNTYNASFKSVDGLVSGAKVMLNGIRVGAVDDIRFDPKTREIRVELSIDTAFASWIREDSTAEMATQGVLGDKYISIASGSENSPPLPSGSDIPAAASSDLSQIFSSGSTLLQSLNSISSSLERLLKSFEKERRNEIFFDGMAKTAKNLAESTEKLNSQLDGIKLKSSIHHLNGILEKVNNGSGTLGALVNDPSLYEDTKALMGGANRNRIVRNLVRKTVEEQEDKDARAAASQKKQTRQLLKKKK